MYQFCQDKYIFDIFSLTVQMITFGSVPQNLGAWIVDRIVDRIDYWIVDRIGDW